MGLTDAKEYLWVLYGIIAILVIFAVSILYSPVADISTALRTPIALATPLDTLIPLVPPAIIIYWYIFYSFIFFSYFYFAFVQREYRNALVLAFVLINLVAYAIYLVQPVIMVRPTVTGTDFFSVQIALLYQHDVPVNCFPSLHGSTSLLTAYALWRARKEYGYIAWPTAIAVMISTLLVRQHWIVDQLAAAAITLPLCYFAFNWFKYTRVEAPTTRPSWWQLTVSIGFAVGFMALYLFAFYIL